MKDHATACMNVSLVYIKQSVSHFLLKFKQETLIRLQFCLQLVLQPVTAKGQILFTLIRNTKVMEHMVYTWFRSSHSLSTVYNCLGRCKKCYDRFFRNNKKRPARFSACYCSTVVVLHLRMCATVIFARHVLLEKSVIQVVKKK